MSPLILREGYNFVRFKIRALTALPLAEGNHQQNRILMQKWPGKCHQLQLRWGFSLVELLIVMAVLTAVAGLILPSMRGPLDKSRLTGAAMQVQASLAKARSLAIREGLDVYFRYEISGDRYVIERLPSQVGSMITVLDDPTGAASGPSGLTSESIGSAAMPNATSSENETTSIVLRESQLPTGVTFAETEMLSSEAIPAATAASAGMSSATTIGLRHWSEPIRFRPSGRTEDQKIRLAGQRDFVVDVTLRGLTSMAGYSAPTRVTPQVASTDSQVVPEALP